MALRPVAFDLETTGFAPDDVVTVAGLATDVGTWQVLNTDGKVVDSSELEEPVAAGTDASVTIVTEPTEADLLSTLGDVARDRLDGDRQYLCAFNGETWRAGFDLPFLRTVCARANEDWPFPPMAYADVRSMVDRFNTGETGDLVGVHGQLVGRDHTDPFDDSAMAVEAFESADWVPLLAHNLADLRRTHELAVLAGRYVPKSDFRMKNLEPPSVPRRGIER